MSQVDIMEFFDEHPEEYFCNSELQVVFKGKMNRNSIGRALTKIIKREEYHAIMYFNKTGRKTLYYGVKK